MKRKSFQLGHKVLLGATLFILGSAFIVGAIEDVQFVHEKVEYLR